MKTLCLNCRGLGQPEAVQELCSLIELHRPCVVFLSETRLFDDRVDGLVRMLGLAGGYGVGSHGRGGGLALLWNQEVDVKLESYNKSHIDVTVTLSPVVQWRFTGFYGEPNKDFRFQSWNLLKHLKSRSNLPWLCAGDFNECLDASEHIGGQGRPERQMEGFREAVEVCGFTDLGYIGLPYTWDNRQPTGRNVKVRLDRGLADEGFMNLFSNNKVWHIQTTESDHCCLVLECSQVWHRGRRRKRRFRYENMWRRDATYVQMVEEAWHAADRPTTMDQLAVNIDQVSTKMQEWGRSIFGSVRQELAALRIELETVRRNNLHSGPSRQERHLMAKIAELLAKEECMEQQRSRIQWLKEGDRNTAFFQAKSRERAKNNRIHALKREDGSLASTQEELEVTAMEFYTKLFTRQEVLDPGPVIDCVPTRVTTEMNEFLTKPFTPEEVKAALFMMGPNKAPGPDGLTAGFFQFHWEAVGQNVMDAVLHFLNGGRMPESVNSTTLVLIPKVKHPQEMKQFRPISLCNVIYKICSKILANRLRGCLDEIISEEQSAFVPGRLITDNVLVAYECTHYLKRKKGKMGACAVKLDMAKAYDRVEWEYLKLIMLRLGFHENFVSLIMKCVSSVSFSVRVNGSLSSVFKPTRGIRQGDPISPYLFLLCAEGLSCLLKSVGPMHLARGARVGIHAPWISHLLFADDCIVFSEASQRGAARLQEILVTYSRGSGQMINKDKSAVFFSSNCDDQMKEMVRQELHIDTEALCDKYLGLPTALGRSTAGAFDFMATRIRNLVGTWSGREASYAGREVLLKSVAQAVPTYSMSCFLLSKTTCKKMRSSISNYWWGGSATSRHMHWLRWDRMTDHKSTGGMGFRDLHLFNKSMLGKQGWRLMTRPESLCARVLKGRYYHDGEFMTGTRKKHASHTWCAILTGKDALKEGLIRRIGNGTLTNIWRDRWIPAHFNGQPITPEDGQGVTMVSDLLTEEGEWDEQLIRDIFVPVDANAILSIPRRQQDEDRWAWEPERHGVYSVKSAYRKLYESRGRQEESVPGGSGDVSWNKIWKLLVPPKVKVFWWRVLHEFLPAKEILHRRHIEPTCFCEVCGNDVESIRHILMECTVAKSFWREVKILNGTKLPSMPPATWERDLLSSEVCNERERSIIIIGMYALWTQRNQRRHDDSSKPINILVRWCVDTAFDLWNIQATVRQVEVRQQVNRWKPPPTGWTKCNTDGAFNPDRGEGATGVVLRDASGQFVGAKAVWYPHGFDALTLEALACRDGVLLARDKGVTNLIVETDCQELVKLWQMSTDQRSVIAPIIRETRLISSCFENFDVTFVSRSCNRVAHQLAKEVSGDIRLGMWHLAPSCVAHLLISDCNPD